MRKSPQVYLREFLFTEKSFRIFKSNCLIKSLFNFQIFLKTLFFETSFRWEVLIIDFLSKKSKSQTRSISKKNLESLKLVTGKTINVSQKEYFFEEKITAGLTQLNSLQILIQKFNKITSHFLK